MQKVHKVDVSSASVKRDNEGERVRAQPMCALQLLLLSNTDAVRIRGADGTSCLSICARPLLWFMSNGVKEREAKEMAHLPVLHGSGVVRQSHAALQEERKKKQQQG